MTSAPVLFAICPPEHPEVSAAVHVPPLPLTVSPPVAPVLFRMMPALLLLPVESMLRKVIPLAPIVVLATFRAVPVVEVIVLVAPVTFTVPPPVAVKPAFAAELIVTFEKLKVALPLLPVRLAPVPPFVLSPVKVSVPAILAKLTPVPAVVVTVTLFSTKAPVIVAELVIPVELPVLRSSELTVSLLPPSVTVPVRTGFVPEAIVSPFNVNVEP